MDFFRQTSDELRTKDTAQMLVLIQLISLLNNIVLHMLTMMWVN